MSSTQRSSGFSRERGIAALVVGEVEVVAADWVGDPVGDADQGWALDVGADVLVQVGADDRAVEQAGDAKKKQHEKSANPALE